jgi:thiamine-monophosphate kinase
LEQAFHGGEDYELLFTLRGAAKGPKGTTRIGLITGGNPGEVRWRGALLEPLGYDHFRKTS